jgi:NDP-sugar pyrophosphorylase family protein
MKAFQAAGQPALMCVFRNDNRWDASNVVYEGGRVVAYDKQRRTPAMHHIDYGCGILSPQVFDRWPGDRPFDLADVYRALAAEGRLAGFEVRERFYEIGSPAGLAETRAYLAGATSTS